MYLQIIFDYATFDKTFASYCNCTCNSEISVISSSMSLPSTDSYFCSYFASMISSWSWSPSWTTAVMLAEEFIESEDVLVPCASSPVVEICGFVLPYFSWMFRCLFRANLKNEKKSQYHLQCQTPTSMPNFNVKLHY